MQAVDSVSSSSRCWQVNYWRTCNVSNIVYQCECVILCMYKHPTRSFNLGSACTVVDLLVLVAWVFQDARNGPFLKSGLLYGVVMIKGEIMQEPILFFQLARSSLTCTFKTEKHVKTCPTVQDGIPKLLITCTSCQAMHNSK